jgi:hypothetical protein
MSRYIAFFDLAHASAPYEYVVSAREEHSLQEGGEGSRLRRPFFPDNRRLAGRARAGHGTTPRPLGLRRPADATHLPQHAVDDVLRPSDVASVVAPHHLLRRLPIHRHELIIREHFEHPFFSGVVGSGRFRSVCHREAQTP